MGDGDIPEIPDEVRVELAERYIKTYEIITGHEFKVEFNEPILERITKNLGL